MESQFYVFGDNSMLPVDQVEVHANKSVSYNDEVLAQLSFWQIDKEIEVSKIYSLKGTNYDHESAYRKIFIVIRWMLAHGCPFIPVDRICSDVIGNRIDIDEEGSIDAFAQEVYTEMVHQP